MTTASDASARLRAIVTATLLAGTLDIASAFVFAGLAGTGPLDVLRGVGGAIVDRKAYGDGLALPAIGLALHFAIMAVMAAVYVLAASRLPILNRRPLLSGAVYGVILWAIMYWIVLPQRWPTLFPIVDPTQIAMQLFSHIVLVGIPIALVARSAIRETR